LFVERMMNMIKKAIAFLLVAFGLLGAFPAISYGQYTGVVSVDRVTASPGDQVAVPVRIANNNLAFAGLTVPLRFPSQFLTVDSISFDGSIITSDFTELSSFDNTAGTAKILYIVKFMNPIPTISTSDGIIATIHFSVSPEAPIQVIPLDSMNVKTVYSNNTVSWERVNISDQSGLITVLPDFQAGAVDVQLVTAVDDEKNPNLPTQFALGQNYPNPFNPATSIEFTLPKAGQVKLEVFNILGQSVKTLIDRSMVAGLHRVEFDGGRMPSGIYFYRLTHAAGTQTRKMALIK